MNSYCINLVNVPDPLLEPVDVKSLHLLGPRIIHKKISDADINPELVSFLRDKGLRIGLAESFYLPKHSKLRIHEDGGIRTDALKINWVYGGEGSVMNWYNPIKAPIWAETGLGIPFRSYTEEQVELIYSCTVGCPSMLQVAPPHNVVTADSERFCVSLAINTVSPDEMASFTRGLEIFSEYFS